MAFDPRSASSVGAVVETKWLSVRPAATRAPPAPSLRHPGPAGGPQPEAGRVGRPPLAGSVGRRRRCGRGCGQSSGKGHIYAKCRGASAGRRGQPRGSQRRRSRQPLRSARPGLAGRLRLLHRREREGQGVAQAGLQALKISTEDYISKDIHVCVTDEGGGAGGALGGPGHGGYHAVGGGAKGSGSAPAAG